MGKKKTRTFQVTDDSNKEKPVVIDMNRINIQKAYHAIEFKTGKHMTAKDRPRKKKWSLDE